MDELESRLERELSGLSRVPLAEPVAVNDLHRRARRVRVGRAATTFVAVATAVAVVGAIVATAGSDSRTRKNPLLRVSAPGFVLGDVDAVVLSAKFDPDGARASLPPALAAKVKGVPGVLSVSGVLDTFAPVQTDPENAGPRVPPRSSIMFSYHKDDDVNIVAGRAPAADKEIAVDADFLARNHTAVGDKVQLRVKSQLLDFTIVGTFDLPGVDLTGIPLTALSAAHQAPDLELDRIDVNLASGANAADVRAAIAAAVGDDYTVVPPSAITFADQRLAQLEIQHAYWALLSPDPAERTTSGIPRSDAQEKKNYQQYSELAESVELRVENVTFLSPDAAALTFRIYYGGSASPVINAPQTGSATRVKGHWQLSTNTLCSLAALVGIKCEGEAHVTITPPNGYEAKSTLDPEILRVFTVLADPHATVGERAAAVANGDAVWNFVQAGVDQDKARTKSELTIAGWRASSATRVEVLYSLQTDGPSTPWPSTAIAEKHSDGRWYAAQQYACGINALAGGGCYTGQTGEGGAGPNGPAQGPAPVTGPVAVTNP